MRIAAALLAALLAAACGEEDLKRCAALRRADPVRALAHCNAALENRMIPAEKRAQLLIDRGALHADLKDWQRAITDLTQALALERIAPQSRLVATYQRGAARLQKGDLDGAIADLGDTLKLDPRHADAWANRALARRTKGDLDGAIADAGEALKLEPGHALALAQRDAGVDAFYRRSLTLLTKGDLDHALADVGRAIDLGLKSADAFNTRGWIRLQMNELDAAIEDFSLALALNDRHLLALGNRSRAFSLKKEHARTLADLEAIARLAPDAANYRGIAALDFYLGRYAESAAANSEALRRKPDDRYAALWRYLAQSRLGQAKEARAALIDATKPLPAGAWPAPVVEHYLGRLTELALLAAADDPDTKRRSEQLCEANFYAAMAKLLRKQKAQAMPQLRTAEKDCPRDFVEYDGAVAELKRLGK